MGAADPENLRLKGRGGRTPPAGSWESFLMDGRAAPAVDALSPYHRFSRAEWAALRADTPLTLTLVQYGVQKEPSAIPGVRAAGAVICSAADGTNLSPAQVVADIGSISPSLNTPTAILIENSALTLYIGVWDSYGADAVNRSPELKLYLQATCAGINAGLGTTALTATAPKNAWPMVK